MVPRTGCDGVGASLPIELLIETSGQFLLNEVGVVINHVPDAGERLAGNSIFWRSVKKQAADVL